MAAAGKLDRRVQFRRATLADDGFQQAPTWANLGNPVWAEKKDVSDAERVRAQEVNAQLTTRFRVRRSTFTEGITPKDQLVCEGVAYEITGKKEVDRRRMMFELTTVARIDR